MKKLLGIDYGEKRIGLAISDDIGMFAHEFGVMSDMDDDKILEYLREVITRESIDGIVLGLPINMSGEDTEKTQEARDFGAMLESCLGVEVFFEDERWTTKMVDKTLREMDVSQKKARTIKDMVAAKYILQSYLDSNRESIEE